MTSAQRRRRVRWRNWLAMFLDIGFPALVGAAAAILAVFALLSGGR